jgi:hypothetical protein
VDSLVAAWSIDRIECDSWSLEGDTAFVYGSNYSGDSCSFQLIRVPGDDIALIDLVFDWHTSNWWESVLPDEIQSDLWGKADVLLNEWRTQIERILTWLPRGQWSKGPGIDYQFEYSVLAFLIEKLAEFGGRKTNDTISKLLGIPLSTAVERVRECRSRGLLTNPGQGIRGQSRMTTKAMKILIEKGVIDA